VNWRLASNGLNRATQILALQNPTGPEEGIYASTLRYRNETFFLVTLFMASTVGSYESLVFTITDPYDDNALSFPLLDGTQMYSGMTMTRIYIPSQPHSTPVSSGIPLTS
jgi:hypothetical protein